MIKKSLTSNEIEIFNEKEKQIQEIYFQEFNDLYPNILKYQSGKFLTNLFKRVKLTFLSKLTTVQIIE